MKRMWRRNECEWKKQTNREIIKSQERRNMKNKKKINSNDQRHTERKKRKKQRANQQKRIKNNLESFEWKSIIHGIQLNNIKFRTEHRRFEFSMMNGDRNIYNLWKLWIFSGSMQIIAMKLLLEFSRVKYFDGFVENIGKCSESNDRLKSPSDIVENVSHLLQNTRYFDCILVRLIKS